MNVAIRRIAAGIVLAAAPALIAVGVATSSNAQTTVADNGPTVSSHPAFPQQSNAPQPGTSAHHHHQRHAR